jgi:hypothetical protein
MASPIPRRPIVDQGPRPAHQLQPALLDQAGQLESPADLLDDFVIHLAGKSSSSFIKSFILHAQR